MPRTQLLILALLLATAGCTSNPDDIEAIEYPDSAYADLSCVELANEYVRLSDEVLELTGRKRGGNQLLALTRRILFLPILFVMENTAENKVRLARLKGQYEAVERMSVAKECSSQG